MNDNTNNEVAPLKKIIKLKQRFDGYLPVVIDIETAGLNPKKHPILEIAAILVDFNEAGELCLQKTFACHVLPFEGAQLDPVSLEITKIDPYHPFRFAVTEKKALEDLFQFVDDAVKQAGCRRAVLVGHNAHFDLSFIQMAAMRCQFKKNPFHAFTCLDTASLSGLIFGKTVLAKALEAAKMPFDTNKAHSAIYDAERTASLFCYMVNCLHWVKK